MKTIVWLDEGFLQIAKALVLVAAFFGISRKQVMNVFIVFGFSLYIAEQMYHHRISLVLIFAIVMITSVKAANSQYREDDVLLIVAHPWLLGVRVGTTIAPPIMGIATLLEAPHILSLFYPVFFFLYFLCCQSPQNPLTFKDLAKSLIGRLKTGFSPKSSPILQPASE